MVARNKISDTTDVGVDFEGCLDCRAYDNEVRNVANFGLATFYSARNIEFFRNRVFQDGSGASMHEKLSGKKYGKPRGIGLIGLRSAGFGQRHEQAVTVHSAKTNSSSAAMKGWVDACQAFSTS